MSTKITSCILCPSQATVFRWFAEFKSRSSSLSDEYRSGRPATTPSPENVAIVEQMLREDPRCIYAQIQSAVNIGSAAVKTILNENFVSGSSWSFGSTQVNNGTEGR